MSALASESTEKLVGGRYRLVQLLKRAAGVETYLARDERSDEQVVVKVAGPDVLASTGRLRLAHAAAVMARLDQRWAAPLLAFGEDGPTVWLAQTFVPGDLLKEHLDRGVLTVESTLAVAVDVLRALSQAHGVGVVHRDVKPGNIIVRGANVVEGATLVDFGLARSAWLDPALQDQAVGTARYLAPETAGVVTLPVDERSDLYSLGVVLFECLAGRPPFDGGDIGTVLRQHLSVSVPDLRALGLSVPRALSDVVSRLLRVDPAERYQTAAAVLHDVEQIVAARRAGIEDPLVVVGLADRRCTLTEPAFVGRTSEVQALFAEVERARSGDGGLVLLEGESGGGKTRLLEELANRSLSSGAWVTRGQGVDQTAQLPFQLITGIAAAIVDAAATGSALVERLREALGDRAEAVVAALPMLGEVLLAEGAADLPPDYGEVRSVRALPLLLDALGSAERPAVVLLDDCQWADTVTVRVLAEWSRSRRPGGRFVVVVAAFRSEEVRAAHPLRALDSSRHLVLDPIGEPEILALVRSMAGPLPEEILDALGRLSEGSPFMAQAVLRGLIESAALTTSEQGWIVDRIALAKVQTSDRAADFLGRRLHLLSPGVLRLLVAGAVLGREFDVGFATVLSRLGPTAMVLGLDEARRKRILWLDEPGDIARFTHDKLREALLGQLEPSERMALHLAAARHYEACAPAPVFELAYHFEAAGRLDEALPFALAAAEQAASRHALEVAETNYRIAARAAPDAGTAVVARVAEGLAGILTLQGRYPEASEQLELARRISDQPERRAALEGKLGDLALRQGDQGRACAHLERALRQMGRSVPRHQFGFAIRLAWEVLVQFVHCLLPRRVVGRRSLEGADREMAAVRVLSRLAHVYWFRNGRVRCAWAHLREMNLAERYGPSPELAQAWSEHSPVMTMLPWFTRAIAYGRRSLAMRVDLGDVWGQGQSLSFLGIALYAASRYQECIDACQESARMLARTGDQWESNTATWQMGFANYRLGKWPLAVSIFVQVHHDALAIGDQTAAGIALGGWARATGGHLPPDAMAGAPGRDNEDVHTATEVSLAVALGHLAEHRPVQAAAVLEEAWRVVRRAGLRQEYVAPALPWLVTSRRAVIEGMRPWDRRRRHELRRARRLARQAVRLSRSYRNNLPHALREQAQVALLSGQTRRARRRLDRALTVARSQGARHEEALVLNLIDRQADDGAPFFTGAPAGPAEASIPVSLSQADRFSTLLAAGRSIASAVSPDAVFEAVRDAAALLLRGDRCSLVDVDVGGADQLASRSGELLNEVARTLVQRAVDTGGIVTLGSDLSDPIRGVLAGLEVRSALCAPITRSGEVVACIYISSDKVEDLFGAEEEQLASFVVELAGAALEHVVGSELRYRSLIQNAEDITTILDQHGIVTYVSPVVVRTLGYTVEELVGQRGFAFFQAEAASSLSRQFERAVTMPAERVVAELPARHRDGSLRWLKLTYTNLFHDPAIRGVIINAYDITARHQAEAQLSHQAGHDALTGLPNRRLLLEHLCKAMERDGRLPGSLALFYLDLDRFKVINDSMGHELGDQVLVETARRLQELVRGGDTLARLGGDEFVVVAEDLSEEGEAAAIAQRIEEAVALPMVLSGGVCVTVTVSIGIAFTVNGRDATALMRDADTAMYRAKERGRHRHEIFDEAMRAKAMGRLRMEAELRRAMADDTLAVHYQPIVDLDSGDHVGVEALVRLVDLDGLLVGPDEFIGVAEETGLIVDLGAWVLRRACRDVMEWSRRFAVPPLRLAVNVSPRQLMAGDLPGIVADALAESGLPPSALAVEFTEAALLEADSTTVRSIEELKAYGVSLGIDDFGTGYSSLSYLRRFPVDFLKIDRSFVGGLGTEVGATAIVRAVLRLGEALGLTTVAEGIETQAQHEALLALGCRLGQGYRFGRPAAGIPTPVAAARLAGRS
ncbi:MAG: EAL domain-containing protein [Acidimicrobiales bacterium]